MRSRRISIANPVEQQKRHQDCRARRRRRHPLTSEQNKRYQAPHREKMRAQQRLRYYNPELCYRDRLLQIDHVLGDDL